MLIVEPRILHFKESGWDGDVYCAIRRRQRARKSWYYCNPLLGFETWGAR
jgi:hypothetical protein